MSGRGRGKSGDRRRRISLSVVLATSLLVLFCDQCTKHIVLSRLSLGSTIPVLKDIFHITLVYNRGAAFGMLKDQPLLFIIIGSAAAVAMLFFMPRVLEKGLLTKLSFALVLGGVLGNLIDRMISGHVIDFIDLRVWPVFNIADSAITVGIALIVIKLLVSKKEPVSHHALPFRASRSDVPESKA
ncbi:MAG: signal peptidase II [Candidatus Omnitrophota bacterium]